VKLLDQFILFATLLENEIRYSLADLSQVLHKLAASESLRGLTVLGELDSRVAKGTTCADSWAIAMASILSMKSLDSEDAAPLTHLFEFLGTTDIVGQTALIDETICRINLRKQAAMEEYTRKGKMYRTLGFLLGVAVVVVII